MTANNIPWASGPGELLRHGLELLQNDSDVNRRLAMISIDNAVELMIKTYLGLPSRVTSLKISKADFQSISESFPRLLDALECHAATKLAGIDLGAIEWYHRLRNELYHQGNGLTVERDKVNIYAELANTLFENLFGTKLVPRSDAFSGILGDFMTAWGELESKLLCLSGYYDGSPRGLLVTLRILEEKHIVPTALLHQIESLRKVRNAVTHGEPGYRDRLNSSVVEEVRQLTQQLDVILNEEPSCS